MIDRMSAGELPAKPHTISRGPDGAMRHEHCLTRHGFDGAFTILYREAAPHVHTAVALSEHGFPDAATAAGHLGEPLLRRHYLSADLPANGRSPMDARVPILANADVVVGVLRPGASDLAYFENGDGDDLYYIHEGGGLLRTLMGDVAFGAKDYVLVPRGVTHRFILEPGVAQHWLCLELLGDFHVPRQFRNETGQLRMDAPYTHRDFRRPVFDGPRDEGIRTVVGKRDGVFSEYTLAANPLDVVGWDGTVWPFAFPILAFQPKTGSVHLPPTIHGTFATRGGLICSFVPRLVDTHPEAIPCPYPHQSVHCDEAIFYCDGHFTSRRGVGPGSISYHPMGTMHGPHPGAYEASIGQRETTELAVMLDTFSPLRPTSAAKAIEQAGYHMSFVP
ncbi:MAG: homogentisate 1,2-dioxygenase [Myxococcota bacterium]